MAEAWTSYERVKAALEHREPDRVPFDLGGSVLTGMHRVAYEQLRRYLGLPDAPLEIVDDIQQLARIHQDVLDLLQVDVRAVDPEPASSAPLATPVVEEGGVLSFTDEWGITWKTPSGGGLYFDMRTHPLALAEQVVDLERYLWPDPTDPARFETLRARADHYVHEEKKAYILGRSAAGIFEVALWMRGFEAFFADLALRPGFAEALLDIITELKMQYWGRALDTVGTNVLVVSEADDIATQRGPIISPAMYRRFIAPRHRRLFGFIRKRAQARVYIFYHSCGAVKDLIPQLLDEGIDILNPVQVSAARMDPVELKESFGRKLTFWGGACDTQHLLPFGTPEEVAAAVRRNVETFKVGGGYVFNNVHNVQADVPPANVRAMFDAAYEAGFY